MASKSSRLQAGKMQKGKGKNVDAEPRAKGDFEQMFPNIAAWVDSYGWIEIGRDDYSRSFMRVLDIGGMIWESKPEYKSLDHALRALDRALEKRIEEIG
jgi:hypothetical protein